MRKSQLNIKLSKWVLDKLRALTDDTGKPVKKGPHIEELLIKEHGWDENMGDEAGVVKDE